MTYPEIGSHLEPKRGKKIAPATVRQLHRKDRMVALVLDTGERRILKLTELRKLYRV